MSLAPRRSPLTLGIMQPYFFPYLGHFQLIAACDRWVVFDVVKYKKKSWMNRNRVLKPDSGWQYVSVPVNAPEGASVGVATMVDAGAAKARILGQLAHYRGKAPHFRQVCGLVEAAFATTGSNLISDLNIRSLELVCEHLGIPFDWSLCSATDLDLPAIEHAGQWALEISGALGATRYINPPGGRGLFRSDEWEDRGIELRFLNPAPMVYATGPYGFVQDLSVLDVLMWNDSGAVAEHLRSTLSVTE